MYGLNHNSLIHSCVVYIQIVELIEGSSTEMSAVPVVRHDASTVDPPGTCVLHAPAVHLGLGHPFDVAPHVGFFEQVKS